MIIMFILKRPAQRMGDVPYKKWQCGACGFIYDEELGDALVEIHESPKKKDEEYQGVS